jgi:hypothetical protein
MKIAKIDQWAPALRKPSPGDHIVYTYQQIDMLSDAVGLYLQEGFRQNEGLIVMATSAHWKHFAERLKQQGMPVLSAIESGQLVVFSAERVLEKFLTEDGDDWEAFGDYLRPKGDPSPRPTAVSAGSRLR